MEFLTDGVRYERYGSSVIENGDGGVAGNEARDRLSGREMTRRRAMRPYRTWIELEQLREARTRAREIAEDWRIANSRGLGKERESIGGSGEAVKVVRRAVGRSLIGIGSRVLPGQQEPCA
jgi:hypothetical protein